MDAAKLIQDFIREGGDPKYDLSDPKRYSRVVDGTYFGFESPIAGMQHPAVGDVGGYYRHYGEWTPGKAGGDAATRLEVDEGPALRVLPRQLWSPDVAVG